jgi:hypothetical protein
VDTPLLDRLTVQLAVAYVRVSRRTPLGAEPVGLVGNSDTVDAPAWLQVVTCVAVVCM